MANPSEITASNRDSKHPLFVAFTYFSINFSKTACTLPKTPSVKRRKIDETQIKQEQAKSALDDNEEHEVVEDKRPRQLKPRRNTKTKNRRSSKPRRSKQVCKKVVTEVRQSTRITRATHKNDALENSVFEKDAR